VSHVAFHKLQPRPIHAAVIYALAEMKLGPVAYLLALEYHPGTGWTLNR
jgi:hypothetical protein